MCGIMLYLSNGLKVTDLRQLSVWDCVKKMSRGGEGELGGGRWGKMGIVGEKGGIIVKAAAQIDSNFAVRLLVTMRLDVSQLVGKLETSHT